MATPAVWWFGPEFQKDILVHSFCHKISVFLIEWVSSTRAISILVDFKGIIEFGSFVLTIEVVYICG